MSAETYVDPDSVDLTEDERSSDGNFSQQSSPLHFVDCSAMAANPVYPNVVIDSHKQLASESTSPITEGPKQLGCKNIPNILKKRIIKSKPDTSKLKPKNPIGKFTSVQICPSSGIIPETQEADSTKKLETVCLDSDDDESLNTLPEQQNMSDSCNSTIYSQKQPGKVVIIKKNNKYYKIVIPHNVMPDVNQSMGPVLINIPEVGPLVITTDPQVTKSNVDPKPKLVQQLLNLDDMDQRQVPPQSNVPQKKINAPSVNAREAVLCDKKFCWTYMKNRKRDLEGFTFNDRLGFNQAESNRARKCWRTLDSIISKKKKELIQQMYAYNTFKDAVNIKKTVRLVKINEIVGSSTNTVSGQVREESLHENFEEHDTYDSDLLLTKKVVILNRNNIETGNQPKRNIKPNPPITKKKLSKRERIKKFRERIQHSRATKGPWGKGKRQIHNNKFASLRPCYVQMIREEHVEEAYRKLCKDSNFNNNIDIKSKVNRGKNSIGFVKRNIAPPSEHQQLPKEERFLQNITNILLMRVIETEDRYKKEMNFLKPILIVNEHNLRVINYSDEFSKNNIIYIVSQSRDFPKCILVNEDFISAVELGYVKLIDAMVFCRYVTGSMNLPLSSAGKYVTDHAYCTFRK